MTTPTKEQIEQILSVVPVEDGPYVIPQIITEWEKIKDVDARVEKMCKKNPGIKDFEDFNKAINSPK